jgi:hypothetical protein
MGWTEPLDSLERYGPMHLSSRVHEVESADPTAARWPRYKRNHGATAAFCRFR